MRPTLGQVLQNIRFYFFVPSSKPLACFMGLRTNATGKRNGIHLYP
jgi:hypothetical protein